ncbi:MULTISPECIES: SpoIIE family protein phosphatase [Solibacillus]|uniref:SpoIIE family protein phosphatase n=1 Tax=Solibacillus merdavium TaxID=2762218 RepID=A0ABR8XSB8_9BACL|nr:SpoIIE family protein phosphatase [Solibacillus merdavium]MBD8034834.1 SpoIIE family protein phosphatase [Solibacillus merdavium]
MVTLNNQNEFQTFNLSLLLYKEKSKMIISSAIVFLAFCFAQAVFFEAVVPLFLPFWLIIRTRFAAFQKSALLGGIIGTCFLGFGQVAIVLVQLLFMECLVRFKFLKLSPYILLASSIVIVQLLWQMMLHSGTPSVMVLFYIIYECFFSVSMLFFIRLLTLQTNEVGQFEWTRDKITAIMIILAGVMVGMQSMTLLYFSLPLILLHFLICLVAYTSTVGATVIFSLSLGFFMGLANLSFTGMMILYACTGLVAAIVQNQGRYIVALFSLLPSIFFFFYDATLPIDSVYFLSMLTGTVGFLLVPKKVLSYCQMYYKQQTVSIVQVNRNEVVEVQLKQFQHFVSFMKELVFERFTQPSTKNEKKVEPFLICSSCFKYEQCWGGNREMEETINAWRLAKRSPKPVGWMRVEEQLKGKCIKSSKLLEELESAIQKEHMEREYYHGKKMIALQLRDLSSHFEKLLSSHQLDVGTTEVDGDIQQYLNERDIHCLHIQWLKTEIGDREFICYIADQRDTHVVIQHLEQQLFELLHEPLKGETIYEQQSPIFYRQIKFRSAIRYQLEYDIYTYSHAHHTISGDSYRVFPIHPGLMAVMLSDGMGTNVRAHEESERLIQMMQDCITYNMDPETAMHTMHYVMSLKNDSDMYATMDFALVDLQFGHLWCWKAGGMTTYVLRGPDLFKIESTSAPIGFLPNFAIDTEMTPLLSEDVILMISDGLFSPSAQWDAQEQLFIRLIRQGIEKGASIQVVLFDVMTQFKQMYPIADDCTVMLFRLQHVSKPWQVFRPTIKH